MASPVERFLAPEDHHPSRRPVSPRSPSQIALKKYQATMLEASSPLSFHLPMVTLLRVGLSSRFWLAPHLGHATLGSLSACHS